MTPDVAIFNCRPVFKNKNGIDRDSMEEKMRKIQHFQILAKNPMFIKAKNFPLGVLLGFSIIDVKIQI